MGNSNSSSKAAVVTVAVAAATATAAWVLSSYLSSETVKSQNRSSATESQSGSPETLQFQSGWLETMEDLNCPHVGVNIGASPIYDPETKVSLSGNVVYQASTTYHTAHAQVDRVQGPATHRTTHTQVDRIQTREVKDVHHHFESKESCKQKEKVHDRKSQKSKAKQKLKADTNKQISAVKISERHSKTESIKSYEDTGVQAGRKNVTPLSSKKYRIQKNKKSDNQNSQKLKRKWKLKVDGSNQISRLLAPKIHLQETIKIMSYNIWSIKYYKREKRMNAVNHLIEQRSPDIILLQEVTPEVYIYFQSCNWWEVYRCSIEEKQATKQVFCMMLSKLPVKRFFYKRFVNTKTCKGVSVAKLTSNPKKALTVATCHLKSPAGACTYNIERTSQAKEAIKLLKLSRNVVLGGDMNWDESTDGPFPLTSGWCDAWSDLKPEEDGYTYDTESNAMRGGRRFVVQKRLDRFVCRLKDFDMIDIEIVGTEAIKGVSYKSNDGKRLPLLPSDHYGLILTIRAKCSCE